MSKKRNRENDIIVSFVGGSRDDVCGSAVLLNYPTREGRSNILCDLGMIQGSMSPEVEYNSNKKMLEKIPLGYIDAVFLSHGHIDHTGGVPICGKDKFTGKIIMDTQTEKITKDLLKDSVYLHGLLIKGLLAKGKKSKPLYTEQDLHSAIDKFEAVERNIKYDLNEYVSYEFYSSGHCLGSQIKFYFRLPNNSIKTVVYTGDLSSNLNKKYKPYSDDLEYIPKANAYIFEGTYGESSDRNFSKKIADEEVRQLKKTLTTALQQGKKVFFPCFSFMRTQELLDLLYNFFSKEEWFHKLQIPVYVDGKLTNKICERFTEVLEEDKLDRWLEVKNWSHVRYNKEYAGTLSIIAARECGIYISSSGFVQPKTRSCDYIKNFIGAENSLICFVGYYGNEDSIGGQLVNTPIGQPVKIDGSTIVKSCDVIQFKSFSSHIQQSEIFKYWGQITANRIIVHHASNEAKEDLRELGREYLRNANKTTKISISGRYSSQFVL